MVLTVYANRRSPAVPKIGAGLAAAFFRTARGRPVTLVAEGLPLSARPRDVTFHALDRMEPGTLPTLIADLRRRHHITVVAPSDPRTERAFLALEHADRVLLLSDLSVAGVRGTQRVIRLCASLGYPYDKLRVVLFGVADDHAVSPQVAAAAFKRPVYWRLGALDGTASSLEGLARRILTDER